MSFLRAIFIGDHHVHIETAWLNAIYVNLIIRSISATWMGQQMCIHYIHICVQCKVFCWPIKEADWSTEYFLQPNERKYFLRSINSTDNALTDQNHLYGIAAQSKHLTDSLWLPVFRHEGLVEKVQVGHLVNLHIHHHAGRPLVTSAAALSTPMSRLCPNIG